MLPAPSITRRLHASSTVTTVTYSPDGRLLAAVDGQNLWLWDAETSALVWSRPVVAQDSYAVPLAFSPDSRQLAVASSGIRVVDVDTGAVRADLPAHDVQKDFAWSPDSALLAAAREDGCDIWRVTDKAVIARVATSEVTHIAFEDDRSLVVASCIALVRYPFDPALAVDASVEPPCLSPEDFAPVAYGLLRIADGWLADGGDEEALEVFAFHTLEHVRTLTIPVTGNRRCFTASASGDSFALVAEDAELNLRRILVLDSRSGEVRQDVDLYAGTDHGGANIRSLSFRPGESEMAIAAGDEVLVWSQAR